MAEKGVLINDQSGGESIATRDAFETDDGANARVIQRIDFATGRVPTPMGAATRSGIASAESTDLTNLPAGLISTIVDCGDKSKLVVCAEFKDEGDQTLTITPIVFDNEVSPGVITLMAPQTTTVATPFFQRGVAGKNYVEEALVWDLQGAHRIGLHVTALSGAVGCGGSQPACLGVDLWGFVI